MRDRKGGKEWIRHFLPLLRPFRKQLCLALSAMVLEAAVSVFRPWPLKVVIDRVLSHKPSRVPLLRAWLDNAPYGGIEILRRLRRGITDSGDCGRLDLLLYTPDGRPGAKLRVRPSPGSLRAFAAPFAA